MKKKIAAVLVIIAVVGGGALLLNRKSQSHDHEMRPPMLPAVVETRLLTVGHTRLTLPVVADVQALRDSVVSSRLLAYVTALPLFEGGRFKRGDLLARLDMTPSDRAQGNSLETELAAAESNLKTEQERLHRAQLLYKIQGVSLEQVQVAEAAFAGARSRQMVAKENLRGAIITATFDGVVSQRLAQPGDLLTPGKPLLKITDTSAGNRLLVNVPETVQPAGLIVGDSKIIPLTPWPEAGPQGLRRFEARSQDGALLPGSRIAAQLVIFRSPAAVLLPSACLLNDDGHEATVLALKDQDSKAMSSPPTANPMHPVQHEDQAKQHHGEDKVQPVEHKPAQAAPEGGHHHKPPATAGQIETILVTLTAQGTEGSVVANAKLAGRRVVCGSPDVLSRLVAGAPFTIQAGKD